MSKKKVLVLCKQILVAKVRKRGNDVLRVAVLEALSGDVELESGVFDARNVGVRVGNDLGPIGLGIRKRRQDAVAHSLGFVLLDHAFLDPRFVTAF